MRKLLLISRFLIALLLVVSISGARGQNPPQTGKDQSAAAKTEAPKLTPEEIAEARELLGALGYWIDLDATKLDVTLRHALIAFQKIEGRERTGVLTADEIEALRNAKRPVARESGYTHLEIDLCRQVLFFVDCCGAIMKTLPISSGSGECFTEGGRTRQAITPIGKFKIKRKIRGWHKSPLGLLYYPSYFYGGVAIHGSPSVPPTPCSHGCVRVPMFAAKELYKMTPIGMDVLIYNSDQ